ncbi:MAG: metal ABC transporter substrate-binding protein [Candidatus Latescibacterota bacterium]|jgi:zinc transport system substrate-binding protein
MKRATAIFRFGCLVLAVDLCLAVFAGPSQVFAEEESKRELTIYTVNYPLKYFAERIAGDHATVVFPAPAGVDPAFWTPDPGTVRDYQDATLILLNGATYAKWTTKATLPQSRCVNTSKAFRESYIEVSAGVTHSHGKGGEHSHSGTAFTTWLDFGQATAQAEAIKVALSRKLPGESATFEKSFELLANDLLALDEEIKKIVAGEPERPFVASHPVYQYFARRYGVNLKSVMWEPEDMPAEEQWTELEHVLESHPAKWMIWEGAPNPESVKKLESLGVRSVVFDPCGNAPEKGDFLAVMQENVRNLRKAFE